MKQFSDAYLDPELYPKVIIKIELILPSKLFFKPFEKEFSNIPSISPIGEQDPRLDYITEG